MMNNGVEVEAQKVYKRKLFIKVVKIAFLLLLILISIIYLFLYIVYAGGRFTVSLDKNMSNRKNVFLSENGSLKNKARELSADTIEYMDNISIKWLPDSIDKNAFKYANLIKLYEELHEKEELNMYGYNISVKGYTSNLIVYTFEKVKFSMN